MANTETKTTKTAEEKVAIKDAKILQLQKQKKENHATGKSKRAKSTR